MMDKTIKINLGGILFHIDEEAYKILRRYLQEIDSRLKGTPGGAETLDDIESRIAEIFQSQGGTAGVISRDNVEAMISIIGKPEDFETAGEPATENTTFTRSAYSKKMYRNPDDSIISGVCGGIGTYLNIESVWIRLLFILFTCFFLVGLFVYIALWIALPVARSDAHKREMYGRDDYALAFRRKETGYSSPSSGINYSGSLPAGSRVGNAFNEVFRAIGKVLFIIVRIFLILVGISFILFGFFALVSFVMIFFFDYPGYFSTNSFGINLFYLPDFLNYIVNPAIAPWILILTFIAILLPLLAIIYWGVKMIFWFKSSDGIVSIVALILWVISVAALSILLFNEGISFSETAKSVSEVVIEKTPRELYIITEHKVSDLNYDKEISFHEEDYNVYFIDGNKGLYIGAGLNINASDDKSMKINVRKRSSGRSRTDATRKAEGLLYNYRVAGDTIFLDEYFTFPAGTKWSFDDVMVTIDIPEGTKVHFDKSSEQMLLRQHYYNEEWTWIWDGEDKDMVRYGSQDNQWVMTEEGIRRISDKAESK